MYLFGLDCFCVAKEARVWQTAHFLSFIIQLFSNPIIVFNTIFNSLEYRYLASSHFFVGFYCSLIKFFCCWLLLSLLGFNLILNTLSVFRSFFMLPVQPGTLWYQLWQCLVFARFAFLFCRRVPTRLSNTRVSPHTHFADCAYAAGKRYTILTAHPTNKCMYAHRAWHLCHPNKLPI